MNADYRRVILLRSFQFGREDQSRLYLPRCVDRKDSVDCEKLLLQPYLNACLLNTCFDCSKPMRTSVGCYRSNICDMFALKQISIYKIPEVLQGCHQSHTKDIPMANPLNSVSSLLDARRVDPYYICLLAFKIRFISKEPIISKMDMHVTSSYAVHIIISNLRQINTLLWDN